MTTIDRRIDAVVRKALTLGYKPYKGPGGPTTKQMQRNHHALAQSMKRFGALVKMVKDPFNPGEQLEVVSIRRKKVIYDRWGFCDLVGPDLVGKLDQATIGETVAYLLR